MAHENILNGVLQVIQQQDRQQDEEDFQAWFTDLLEFPEDYQRQLKDAWIADLELQPLRWMNLGIELFQSPNVQKFVELPNGVQGPPLNTYLPYPIFQSGTEIFLKGMWLCRHEDCRLCDSSSYVTPARRQEILLELTNKFGHNLIKLLGALHASPEYRIDDCLLAFLRVVSAMVRRDYFPLISPAKTKNGLSRAIQNDFMMR